MRRPQIWKKSPTCFDKTAVLSSVRTSGIFFQISWPFQKSWTLPLWPALALSKKKHSEIMNCIYTFDYQNFQVKFLHFRGFFFNSNYSSEIQLPWQWLTFFDGDRFNSALTFDVWFNQYLLVERLYSWKWINKMFTLAQTKVGD